MSRELPLMQWSFGLPLEKQRRAERPLLLQRKCCIYTAEKLKIKNSNKIRQKIKNMTNKNKPRVYWDENEQRYYITFFEDTKSDEIISAWERFKGRKSRQKKEHDKSTN